MKKTIKRILCIMLCAVVLLIGGYFVWNIALDAYRENHKEVKKSFSKEDEIDVVYIGNSLLAVPGISYKVEKCAQVSGYTINTHDYLSSGATLKEALERAEKLDVMKTALAEAEVVVLQEYGNHYETTYDDICEIVKLCGEEAEIYYYMTDFDYDQTLLQNIANNERVHLIPAADIVMLAVMELGYDYETDMLKPGDYHPSQTYAHICGLVTFSAITGQKCMDYPITEEDDIFSYMKGETAAEKQECFNQLYEMADELIANYENSFKTWY